MLPDWLIKGGPVMVPLLACSMAAVTIALERGLFWWRYRRSRDRGLVERMGILLGEGRAEEARALGDQTPDPVARVVRFGLDHTEQSLEAALEMAAAEEIRRMRRFLRVLDTIVTLAPLLGILGTILGIIGSFQVLGEGRFDDPLEVTGGIAEALVSTAVGLVVAMVALIPYNYFSARLEDAAGAMAGELTAVQLMAEKGRSA